MEQYTSNLTKREDELLLDLCHEAGDQGEDQKLISGARSNHDAIDIHLAAQGDVAALARLRHAFGLSIFV